MFGQLSVLCVLILMAGSEAHRSKLPNVVKTKNGVVAGELRGNFYAFEGMRYAAAPVGENRFQPPQPFTDTWQGVRNSTQIGSACLQWNPLVPGKVNGDEDCLFLNVYKPARKVCRGYKFPVIVHIHGGAFQFGDASFYGPGHIMSKENFVYVSFNYRLGILGFLSTKSAVVPGNMGLKDQVMALKWVHRNIHAFGGDVDSITLTGFSAGAASVHLHYMSPLSAGLFHRGVSHSGTATAEWVLTKNPVEMANTVAELVGCSNTDQQDMVDCMRTKSAVELVKANPSFNEVVGSTFGHPIFTFTSVVEEDIDGAFITMTPKQYLQQRRIQKLPWLTSVTKDEGVFVTADSYSDQAIAKINSNWDQYIALLLDFNSTDPASRNSIATELKSRYFDNQSLSKENFGQLTKLTSQRYFQCAMQDSISLQRKIAPVYSYFYDFKLKFGVGELLSQAGVNLGISHGEDILLLYRTPLHPPDFVYTDEEKLMSEKLLEVYASFAKKGIPKFNNQCLTRSKDRFRYTVINGPEAFTSRVSEPICDAIWKEVCYVTNILSKKD